MIIDKLVIQDFGVYGGRQVMDLAPSNPEKPIILIGGLNGGGKTTLLDALQLCLYGKLAEVSNRKNKSYYKYLKECIHRSNGADSALIEVSFYQVRQGMKHSYSVQRSWKNENNKIRENLVVLKDGTLDDFATENWPEYVNKFLPRNIAPLFFFDGEKVEEYADSERAPELIGNAISGLLGLDTVEQLINDLVILERRQNNKNSTNQTNKDIVAFEKTVVEQREKIKRSIQEIASLKTNSLPRLEKSLSKINDVYKKQGGELYDKRESLFSDLNTMKKKREDLEATAKQVMAGCAPLIMNEELLKDLGYEVSLSSKIEEAKKTVAILTERNKKLLQFLDSAFEDREVSEQTRSFLDNEECLFEELAGKSALLMPCPETNKCLSKIYVEVVTKDLSEIVSELTALRRNIESLQIEIEAIPAIESLSGVLAKRDRTQEDLSLCKLEIRKLDDDLQKTRTDYERNKQSLERLYDKAIFENQSDEDQKRLVSYSKRSRQSLDKYMKRMVKAHIKDIELIVSESFNHLTRKSALVSKLRIDPNNFTLSLYDQQNNMFGSERLSAGERQLLSIAILWGLSKASGRPLPTVIDTPLGRLDGKHRDKLVETYFPFASHQMLMLVTDKEISESELIALNKNIDKKYTLFFDQENGRTEIRNGFEL